MSVPLSDNWKDLWACLGPSLWLPKPLLFPSRLGRKRPPDSAEVAGWQRVCRGSASVPRGATVTLALASMTYLIALTSRALQTNDPKGQ